MLGGKLVRLRAYKKEDMILAQKYVNDPETKILLQSSVPYPYTIEDQGKWYENISALKDTYDFAIETLNGVYLGSCGINSVDWKNSKVEVGMFIGDKPYWGRGYGTDTMKILLKFIFEQMNINRVGLSVFSYNERAIASYKKCGFIEEGIVREVIFCNGKYHDEVIMSVLKREYM